LLQAEQLRRAVEELSSCRSHFGERLPCRWLHCDQSLEQLIMSGLIFCSLAQVICSRCIQSVCWDDRSQAYHAGWSLFYQNPTVYRGSACEGMQSTILLLHFYSSVCLPFREVISIFAYSNNSKAIMFWECLFVYFTFNALIPTLYKWSSADISKWCVNRSIRDVFLWFSLVLERENSQFSPFFVQFSTQSVLPLQCTLHRVVINWKQSYSSLMIQLYSCQIWRGCKICKSHLIRRTKSDLQQHWSFKVVYYRFWTHLLSRHRSSDTDGSMKWAEWRVLIVERGCDGRRSQIVGRVSHVATVLSWSASRVLRRGLCRRWRLVTTIRCDCGSASGLADWSLPEPAVTWQSLLYPGTEYFDNTYLFHPLTPTVANFHMGTVIKHPVPDCVKTLFVIFDIWALWRSFLGVRVSRSQKLQMTA